MARLSDPALRPVVVQDAADGTVLMLAWADASALKATRRSGQAHFWSRSRGRLWRKGETSGNVMHVESVATDCDEDALLYRVHPTGPACHTGRRSCFDADDRRPPPARLSLETLETIIAERAPASTEESYTARLLSGGPAAPAAKVVEEAGEVADAAQGEATDRVAQEAADLLYHLLVLLRSREIPLESVLEVLDARHRQLSGEGRP
ncbi:MAG: bifunctional phosphoribosyl-AMP cyclohydrolase/phosphoribosyl-ATP diphosphatase HisIE [Candidatus Limnocylindria bacterium]